jgi:hypothetical protein
MNMKRYFQHVGVFTKMDNEFLYYKILKARVIAILWVHNAASWISAATFLI